MFKGDVYYNLNKKEKLAQSIKYISNYLVNLARDDVGNVIGITSSLPYKNSKLEICKGICNSVKDTDHKLAFIDVDLGSGKNQKDSDYGTDNFKKIYLSKYNIDDFSKLIKENKQNYNIIIVNIPPISVMAESIQYAKVCGRVVLLERYMYTTYREYEETLIKLKTQGVKIDGVVTYN